ncbi:cobalamin B12-binding domain-containing protein [Kitasatospora xanthocidica]|uniref:cobalamin B12-binding domain-containing protein n=1 Tax=Kitasatospora xanthocidica TaxID=83382 RepID=UPI00216B6275|nr:cobalamin-dependent protein [Kitasatospora xanthocidica]
MSTDALLDVIVSGTESDSHTWNLVFLQLQLEDWGHRVRNLGPCLPGAELAAECRREAPDLIVLSSVNGHGESDGLSAVAELRAVPELADTPIVIGGKLGTGRQLRAGAGGGGGESMTRRLLDAGFSAVFHESAGLPEFERYVSALGAVKAGRTGRVLEELRAAPTP